jgi:Spy/CpxP family protein refolding chaperone
MNRLIWSVALLLLVALPLAAQPEQSPAPRRGLERGMPLKRLDLTDVQEKQVAQLRLDHQKKMVQTRAKIAEGRLDLRAAMKANPPDRSTIERAIRTVSELEVQAKLERTKFWFDVRALLTEKQQETWREMAGKRGPRMRRPHPPRHRMMPGEHGMW